MVRVRLKVTMIAGGGSFGDRIAASEMMAKDWL
jgi:hypothetical protein